MFRIALTVLAIKDQARRGLMLSVPHGFVDETAKLQAAGRNGCGDRSLPERIVIDNAAILTAIEIPRP